MEELRSWAKQIRTAVESVYFGEAEHVNRLLIALLCRGHVLIEDVPGVGKTLLARAFAQALGGQYRQIQCTPDLLPTDVLGVSIYNQKTSQFEFRHGPVMTNVLLVDEINRATPRTQSALLEAMAEGQVSVEGRSLELPQPFFLVATQSRSDSEGTFPLPEVQKDRFFLSYSLGYPTPAAELSIMREQLNEKRAIDRLAEASDPGTVMRMQSAILETHVDERLKDYILAIVTATRNDARLTMGVSPRGSLALFRGAQACAALDGRTYVVPEDVKAVARPVLHQRVLLHSEQSAKGVTEKRVIEEILERVDVPGYAEAG
jgi:MoxR-like ATPase